MPFAGPEASKLQRMGSADKVLVFPSKRAKRLAEHDATFFRIDALCTVRTPQQASARERGHPALTRAATCAESIGYTAWNHLAKAQQAHHTRPTDCLCAGVLPPRGSADPLSLQQKVKGGIGMTKGRNSPKASKQLKKGVRNLTRSTSMDVPAVAVLLLPVRAGRLQRGQMMTMRRYGKASGWGRRCGDKRRKSRWRRQNDSNRAPPLPQAGR